ncbi:hypothetical protein CRG98_009293 [Punica granatum]|uniref:Uncharacterized protein n=1 Tax=Punica granatum TaxID=22663 RepID=A0A2I0KP79_PUNGR|nr:hypothetical protein CRG98_009293 [Punica granatum]
MGSEKCKNSGNDLSRGKETIHGPRKPRGALSHLPWGEAERLLWFARANKPQDMGKVEASRKNGFGKSILPPGTNRPESVKSGRRQTQLAIPLVGAVPVDRDGIFTEKREKWRWCTVKRLSARNHLGTRESEGHEEPLGSDDTTRHSREVVEMSRKPGKP